MGKPLTSAQRWIKPEIYPIFVVIGSALGLCGSAIIRNASINPDVRINKDDRAAGWLENYQEGKAYKDSSHRRFFAKQSKMVTTSLNETFGGAKYALLHFI